MATLNKVTRRRFLGWSAAAGGAGALVVSGAGDALSKQFLGIPAMGRKRLTRRSSGPPAL
ncbi:MAG TPA: twin-arginine translocation signal domain-containing protein [Corynebacterium urealyticum]|nr:twin-arginine translocation signal domain-containing protein [Corynebacterium urealyticum]